MNDKLSYTEKLTSDALDSKEDINTISDIDIPKLRDEINLFINIAPYEKVETYLTHPDPDEDIPGDIIMSKEGKLLNRVIIQRGLEKDIVDSYNRSINENIVNLISETYIDFGLNSDGRQMIIYFPRDGILFEIPDDTPYMRMEQERTYYFSISVMAIILSQGNDGQYYPLHGEEYKKKIILGQIPIMKGSDKCYTVRHKLTDKELFDIGECPDDPSGYFIIDGKEYVITLQDKLRLNQAIIFYKKYQSHSAYIMRMTCENKNGLTKKVEITTNKSGSFIINLKFLNLKEGGFNVFIAMKILLDRLKVINKEQYTLLNIHNATDMINFIIKFINNTQNAKRISLLLKTTEVHYNEIIHGENNEYHYLETFRKPTMKFRNNPHLYYQEAIINDLFYQYEPNMIYNKILHLSLMISQIASVSIGIRPESNRDSWANKRIFTAGPKIYQLFNRLWNNIRTEWEKKISPDAKTKSRRSLDTFADCVRSVGITQSYTDSFKTKWGPKGAALKEKKGTDLVKRESKLSAHHYITRIVAEVSRENKNIEPRKANHTQFGYIDYADTPDAKDTCGVVKNKTMACWISVSRPNEEIKIIEYAKGLYNGSMDKLNEDIFLLNCKFIGFCNGHILRKHLIKFRRNASLAFDTLIAYDSKNKTLYVHTDSGRPTRPLLIVNEDTGNLVIDEKNMWKANIDELLENGCVEYIDALEQEYIYISDTTQNLHSIKQAIDIETTYLNNLINAKKDLIETGNTNYIIYGKTIYTNREDYNKEIMKQIEDQIEIIRIINNQIVDITNKMNILLETHNQSINEINMNSNISDIEKQNNKQFLSNNLNYNTNKNKIQLNKLLTSQKNENEKLDVLYSKLESPPPDLSRFEQDIKNSQEEIKKLTLKSKYTHCEIHPSAIFSISAAVIPTAERNQSVRVGFQCGHGRQSVSIYHSAFRYRFDTTAKTLAYPTRPIFETQFNRLIGLDKYGPGNTVMMAIMTYAGYNQEDSIIFNKASIDRGLFHMMIYRTVLTTAKPAEKNVSEKITRDVTKFSNNFEPYRHLDDRGIARNESVIKIGDCLIGKIITIIGEDRSIREEDASLYATNDHDGMIIDSIRIFQKASEKVVKIKLRQYRIPIMGDKFGSRIGQKSTIGIILPQEDMPYDLNGNTVDVILNPHAFPSRMTVSHLLEMLASLAGVLQGVRINATSFEKMDIDQLQRVLVQFGFSPNGTRTMRAGTTGQLFDVPIYTGPIYYQAMKHNTKDKIQMRQMGAIDPQSKQPKGGRKGGQAQKAGEMEGDANISHGARAVLNDLRCVSSTGFKCVVCQTCGQIGTVHFANNKHICRICKENTNAGICEFPRAKDLLQKFLNVAGLNQSHTFVIKEKQTSS